MQLARRPAAELSIMHINFSDSSISKCVQFSDSRAHLKKLWRWKQSPCRAACAAAAAACGGWCCCIASLSDLKALVRL